MENTPILPPEQVVRARLAEVAERYARKGREYRKRGQYAPANRARGITLIRLREIEKLCRARWGHFAPDDENGRLIFSIAAHHIAHSRGDKVKPIVGWACRWCPWMKADEVAAVVAEVMAKPSKWRADSLGVLLQLTDAERTALKIKTIGAFDFGKAERLARRKLKVRVAARIRRAKRSSGRPRGRPRGRSK